MAGNHESFLHVSGGPEQVATLYSAVTGDVVWEDDLPFEGAVGGVSIASTGGGTYAVAGVRCHDFVRTYDWGQDCQPGGLALAVVDEHTRDWIDLTVEDGAEGTSYVNVLGRYDGAP